MATINQVIGGLQILAAKGLGDTHNICADHDVITAGHDVGIGLSDEEKAAMEALRWFWSEEFSAWAVYV